uniref:Uncharacterized protein n=1 Tax=Oryza barthii TaxID=65489 RepID=A0A0D3HIX4_9ORYZ
MELDDELVLLLGEITSLEVRSQVYGAVDVDLVYSWGIPRKGREAKRRKGKRRDAAGSRQQQQQVAAGGVIIKVCQ